MHTSAHKQWFKALLAIGSIALLGRFTGFFRDVLTATLFGVSIKTDAYLLALVIFDFALIANRTLVSSTVGHFTSAKSENTSIFIPKNFRLSFIVSLIVLGSFLVPVVSWLLPHVFSGLDSTESREFKTIAFIFLLTGMLIIYAGMQSGFLQVLGRINAPAMAVLFLNTLTIPFLLVGYPLFGIKALPLGFLSGTVAFVLWQAWKLRRLKPETRFEPDVGFSEFKRWGWLSVTFFIAQLIPSLGIVADRYFASKLPIGSYSVYTYALKIMQLPFSIVGYALSVSLLPIQSRSKGESVDLVNSTSRGLLAGLVISGFLCVFFYVFAEPLVRVIYEHGQFRGLDSTATASVLRFLALGLIPFILNPILANVAYVLDSPRSLLKVGAVTIVFGVLTSWLLIRFLGSVEALAISFTLSSWLYFALLLLIELRFSHSFKMDKRFWLQAGQIMICLAALTLFSELARHFLLIPQGNKSFLMLVTTTIVCGAILFITFVLMLATFFRSTLRRAFLKVEYT